MEKLKVTESEVAVLASRSYRSDASFGVEDAIREALRLQRVRFIAMIRKEAELFDADLGGDALSNIADLLERDS